MFCSSQFLSTLFAVRSARPRKKNSAAKNYDVEKKKIAYLARAVMSAFGVRRAKAALSSGCKPHPANRSSRKQSEQSWR
jgi:hypothetical protein